MEGGIRKNTFDFESFLSGWRRKLSAADPVWEGTFAYNELKRRSALEFLRCEKEWKDNWRAQDCLERICGELERYRIEAKDWKETGLMMKQEFKATEQYLSEMQSKLEERSQKMRTPSLRRSLNGIHKRVGESRQALDDLKKMTTKMKFVDSPLGAWELLWPEQHRQSFLDRGIALDTRLQVQLGKILATWLRGSYRISLTCSAPR